jgi:hypothetical protein
VKIVPFNQVAADIWNKLVDESVEGWLYHRTEWVELEETEGYQNESFMVFSNEGQPLGIFCVYLSKRGPWWHLWEQYLHTGLCRSGPAMAYGLSDKQRREVTIFALDYLRKRARIYRANRLEVRLPSLAPAYLPPLRSEVNPLWEYGFSAFPKYGVSGIGRVQGGITLDTIVDLRSSNEEGLFKEMSTMCQRAIRKANRSGVTCVEGNGLKALESFYRAYESSHLRSRSAKRPFTFFRKMYENLVEKGWMKTFLALHEGRPIASVLLLCYKNVLTYFAGGIDYSAQQLRPHNLLFWETLRWAQQEGLGWYEIGPYFPYLPEGAKMGQIGHFKRQFGGKIFPLFEGVFFYNWPMYLGGALMEEMGRRIYICFRRLVLSNKGKS